MSSMLVTANQNAGFQTFSCKLDTVPQCLVEAPRLPEVKREPFKEEGYFPSW